MPPNVAQAVSQAVAACQRRDWDGAERLCRAALAAKPDCFEALHLLGVIAGQSGRAGEAADWFARAVAAEPRHADTHFNLGVALADLGRPMEALASYERALALDPARADAHFNRAVVLGSLGRHAEALAGYERVLALDPRRAEAHHNRGIALAELQRAAEALEAFDRAIALAPQGAGAHNSRGVALAALGRHEEALGSYERAIALRPDFAAAHGNRGTALTELDRPAEGLESCDRAVALAPHGADGHYHRGNALRELGRHREAIEAYEHAIALRPEHAAAHWNLADCLLLLGEFERGWREYEWRWRLPARRGQARSFERPPWMGDAPLANQTILLHAELGLGDTLQFCRYATEVARRGARVLLEVQPPLVRLLRGLEGAAQVVARGDALPPFDLHCPIMSLPLAFRTAVHTVPADIPYLRADAARAGEWRARLGEARGPRVGLAWSGSRALRNDKRSMALADALPLLDFDAAWVSVQRDVPEADAQALAAAPLRHLGSDLVDFAETAAILEAIDLLVTVDTSIAHLGGALGKPVWILLPLLQHDWRWGLEGERTPWYPTARLFRQRRAGDWGEVIARVRTALASFAGTRGSPPGSMQ